MRQLNGTHEGDLEVSEAITVTGIVAGNVIVLEGGSLILSGMARCVTVKPGGEAVLNGMVIEDVVNEGGALDVFGMIQGTLSQRAGTTNVDGGAVIRNKRR